MYSDETGTSSAEEARVSAWNEPPDELDLVRDKLAELKRAMDETGYGHERPRLRDRNGFVNALMHGERDTLEQVRPRWQEYRRNAREARRLEAEIDALVTLKVAGEPGYRALAAAAAEQAKARRSCHQLLDSIRAARERVARVDTNEPEESSQTTAKRDFREIATLLDTVRKHADELTTTPAGGHDFRPGEPADLRLEYSWMDSPGKRRKKLKEVGRLLGALEHTTKTLLRDISARASAITAEQHRYMETGRLRYLR